ncbi:MAG: RNA-binding protein [Candidatus Saccharimonadales bacterium]
MATNLFVGGIAYSATDDDLAQHFAQAGTVVSAKIVVDRETNRSKGFGFVEMSSDDEAKKAIDTLNGTELSGRAISVNEARPREERPRRQFDNSGSRGGGFGGGRSY